MTGERISARPLDRRKFLLGAGMLAAAGSAWARMPESTHPRLPKRVLETLVPDVIGPWRMSDASGVVLPPPDELSDRLYDNLLTRVYANATGDPVMLLIAYNNKQDGVLQIHRPEICYPAGGFTLSPTVATEVQLGNGRTLPASTFLASGRDRDEAVLYWTRVGDDFPRRWAEQRWSVVSANLRGEIPDGMLFRISKFGRSLPREVSSLQNFAREFVRSSPDALRKIILGN